MSTRRTLIEESPVRRDRLLLQVYDIPHDVAQAGMTQIYKSMFRPPLYIVDYRQGMLSASNSFILVRVADRSSSTSRWRDGSPR